MSLQELDKRLEKAEVLVESLTERFEKMNTCHNQSDGQFCSGRAAGGGGGGVRDPKEAHAALRSRKSSEVEPDTTISLASAALGREFSSERRSAMITHIGDMGNGVRSQIRASDAANIAGAYSGNSLADFIDAYGRAGFNSEKMRSFVDRRSLSGKEAMDTITRTLQSESGVKRFSATRE